MFSFYFCSTQIVQCSWNRRRRQWNRQQILFTCTVAHVEEERHARMFKCAHKHARTWINWCPSEAPYGWKKAKRRLECDPVQATNIFWQVFFSRLPSIWIYSKKNQKSQKIPQHNMQVYIIADFKWAKQCQMRRLRLWWKHFGPLFFTPLLLFTEVYGQSVLGIIVLLWPSFSYRTDASHLPHTSIYKKSLRLTQWW